ncbi:hypothetical protein HN446_04475 [bacterium]|jgi:hypothetical protein|nr:hypothetical protein [bacterium]
MKKSLFLVILVLHSSVFFAGPDVPLETTDFFGEEYGRIEAQKIFDEANRREYSDLESIRMARREVNRYLIFLTEEQRRLNDSIIQGLNLNERLIVSENDLLNRRFGEDSDFVFVDEDSSGPITPRTPSISSPVYGQEPLEKEEEPEERAFIKDGLEKKEPAKFLPPPGVSATTEPPLKRADFLPPGTKPTTKSPLGRKWGR